MRKLLFIAFLIPGLTTFAQARYAAFFEGFQHFTELDSIPLSEFQSMASKRKKDYTQVMFSYGSEKKKDWSLAYEYITKYADIGRPKINLLTLNGKPYITVSMNIGAEYTHYGLYKFLKPAAENIHWEDLLFYGSLPNDELVTYRPACCDDPTAEFKRIKVHTDNSIETLDSFSIYRNPPFYDMPSDSVYLQKEWITSSDTLYATRTNLPQETYGAFKPGAEIRVLKTETFDGKELRFCEIKGISFSEKKYLNVCNHAFVWLGSEPNPE